tara:strand:+ start:989 stop:1405 length:417 start_codon:yes stop_codon:yes gene_type:complete
MNKKKGPFKMKPSTFKQKKYLTAGEIAAQKKFSQIDRGVDLISGTGDKAWTMYEGFDKKYKKPAKNILSKMWRGRSKGILKGIGASKILGALAVPSILYDFYQSGQKHSGGKVSKDQKSFMEESKKKTKSIFNKKKKK